ncbi:MAG: TonB-dependent receptor, partial [Terriglobia bacterium]
MKFRTVFWIGAFVGLCVTLSAWAAAGTLRGIVHDPQHRPIVGARVALALPSGGSVKSMRSDSNGEFEFTNLPPGAYQITAVAPGFAPRTEAVTVGESEGPVVHLMLAIATTKEEVQVSGAPAALSTESSTTQTVVSQREISRTPGAGLTNSLAMITDFVPGAYMVHDMLHVRGGHQENWFFDGIPVINTNIASNVGPLIDPKNVASLQVQTGGYSPEYGDRTYGFFNVITPSGFNRNNEGELITSYGSFDRTDDLLSFGSHTDRFAYYASVNGNRSDLGLSAPTRNVIHDQESGLGAFASILYNPSAENQFRLVASLRSDHYKIPNTPAQQAVGIRDLDVERDGVIGATWTHSEPGGLLLTVSPFYHFNRANYLGGPGDTPFILNDNRRSHYAGALASIDLPTRKNDARGGVEAWAQHDNTFFGLSANPGSGVLAQDFRPWANYEAVFLDDRYRPASWLTLNGGVRLSHYGGLVSENAADPRFGAAIRIPRLKWILHGYYAQYYQAPPLDTVAGPLLIFALQQGAGFIPLHGERDRQWDAGLSIPIRAWSLDVDHFRTSASDFLDHDEIGSSGIFLPLTDLAALISGTEVSVRSPELYGRARLRIAYSNQLAKGLGPVTGGLVNFAPASYFLLDHDQRNTASAVLSFRLPWQSWASSTYAYGSGFVNGDGIPSDHLPAHSVWDVALGKSFGERFSVSLNALNLANTRFMVDNSNTFGGTH